MNIKRDWPKLIALAVFFALLGTYYERLSLEARTFILPLLIFGAAAFVLGRLRQILYEVRSSRVTALEMVAKQLSFTDDDGKQRISISASSDGALMTFYDEDQVSRATLELISRQPALRLIGEKGSALLAINEDGMPSFTLRDDAEEIVWSAP